jgi:hypothetical protein
MKLEDENGNTTFDHEREVENAVSNQDDAGKSCTMHTSAFKTFCKESVTTSHTSVFNLS